MQLPVRFQVMKLSKPKWLSPELIFLLILITVGLLYNYHNIAFLRPVGVHHWRNCVSAAFPVNYYYGGNFLTPQTNALLADHMTSDVTVVEFPLIYYIISLFYKVLGLNVFWHRMFQVVIGFMGLIYLFKASYYFTRNWFYRVSSKTIEMWDIENYLEEIGVDRTRKVYCTPDRSINISLYFCNRKGLTDYSVYRTLSLEEPWIV